MTFNSLGQPSREDIRVGYIDPELGYIDDVSICQANEYAKKKSWYCFYFC
jgi:hypothetical protein